MKTLYLECRMGAAGDMLMGALSELTDQDAFIERMNHIGLQNVVFRAVPSEKCGIIGTHAEVKINGEEEKSFDVHKHDEHTAEFSFQLNGISSAGERERIEHSLQDIDHLEHAHVSDEGLLTYFYNHDLGYEAENAVRSAIHDENASIEIVSKGHAHHHDHGHTHGMQMDDIKHILCHLDISEKVRKDALEVYDLIAEAESHAHGIPVEEIHFHEVGTMDAIADVVGDCILFEEIGAERIYASSVAVGNGMVKCAHGILPVPAPATAYLLQGIPSYAGMIQGELCTPTGAALLKHFVQSFEVQPTMVTEKIGYGMGTKDFEAANCLRAFLGETEDDGEVCELTCNLDDMSPEDIGHAYDVLFREGALDVYVTPVSMKKNRPGWVFTCMCRVTDKDRMMPLMFKHLSTLGIRESTCRRHALMRTVEERMTSFGMVHVKHSEGYGTIREKAEYEDLVSIAAKTGRSTAEIRRQIEEELAK
jgi:uncharacterized protein (TIGR00299 family) protein